MNTTNEARRQYQDSAVQGATPIELVVLLFDSAIDDMRHALAAMRDGNVESRARQIGHAMMVLQQLQGTLDFERGGEAARQFEQYYNLVRAKLLEAQIRGSSDLMQQQIRSMSEVRNCWEEAKRMLQPTPPAKPTNVVPALMAAGAAADEWRA
jgi:flagellar secretion chaperone FliS